MGIFGSKTIVWIPDNDKLAEKVEDPAQWDAKESFVGWKVCNDGKLLAQGMGGADSCGNFDFSYNGLGDREASVFARVLTTHFKSKHASAVPGGISGKMTKLCFANNHFHSVGVKAIAEALMPETPKILYSLEELDLSNNAAGPEGATAIANMIRANRVIRRVNLAWNNIGNEGFVALASNMTMQHRTFRLDISNNTFDISDQNIEWDEVMSKVKKALTSEFIPQVFIGWEDTELAQLMD
mmetsp:Transcript_49573/g.116881  ORF Transcript_49573/g.116881 Transcript_49573/m.116881 type:complete len:240 (-) Transcript_49573:404-1123(-)